MFLVQWIRITSAGVGGLCFGFLALCKVGFVCGVCVPCNVLKIAWGSVGKTFGCIQLLRCVQIGWRITFECLRSSGIRSSDAPLKIQCSFIRWCWFSSRCRYFVNTMLCAVVMLRPLIARLVFNEGFCDNADWRSSPNGTICFCCRLSHGQHAKDPYSFLFSQPQ